MARNFYADYFGRTKPRRKTPEEQWQDETDYLRNFATSEFGEAFANRFDVPEVKEAELTFKNVLEQISDPELRNEIDMAAGKISRAYQILGFCAGHFSQDSRSRAMNF